jgi:hypothetical protein
MRVTGFFSIAIALLLPAALHADVNLVATPGPNGPPLNPLQLNANAGDTTPAQSSFNLQNTGTSTTSFTFSYSTQDGGNWLSASTAPAAMTLGPGESVLVTVFADPTGLEADSNPGYLGVITISGSGSVVQVNVEFDVEGTVITVAPIAIKVTLLSGQSVRLMPSNAQGAIANGTAQLAATPSTQSGGPWLAATFDPPNGNQAPNQAPTGIEADVDATGLAPGQYIGAIVVSCVGAPCLSKTISVTLTVALPLAFTTTSLPDGVAGKPYSQTPAITGVPPYTWAVFSGTLPPGLSLSPKTGLISGTPTQAGASTFTLLVLDSAFEQTTMAFTLTIDSSGSALPRTGTLSQIASGGGWKTSIYLINASASAVDVKVNLWADSGDALSLPLTTTIAGASQSSTASSVSETIGPNSTLLIESVAPTPDSLTGWAEILSDGAVAGYSAFHYTSLSGIQSEGTVPLEQTFQTAFDLPFDNVNSFGTGVALANLSATQSESISATVEDAAGNQLASQTINLPANGHQSFSLTGLVPAAEGNRGIIHFSSSAGNVTGLGLRVNPLGGFTSVPKLALPTTAPGHALTRAGVLSQVAFGGGWNSLIYLINNSIASLSVTVNFWADDGTPLQVPLIETQAGSSQPLNNSTVSVTIAPNATVVLAATSLSSSASAGWADVLSNGPIAGYGVFHYTSPAGVQSEGTVPLESSFASSFLLPYDNVNRFQTGVAVANLLASQQAAVTATTWDANGSQNGLTAFVLPAGGHQSFQLASEVPAVSGNRGIVEFSVPSGGTLTGLGLRVNPTGGFTSVPKLTHP